MGTDIVAGKSNLDAKHRTQYNQDLDYGLHKHLPLIKDLCSASIFISCFESHFEIKKAELFKSSMDMKRNVLRHLFVSLFFYYCCASKTEVILAINDFSDNMTYDRTSVCYALKKTNSRLDTLPELKQRVLLFIENDLFTAMKNHRNKLERDFIASREFESSSRAGAQTEIKFGT